MYSLHKDHLGKFDENADKVVLETEVSSTQNGQADKNDQPAQIDEILNNDQFEHSNHTNDEQIIVLLPSTEDIRISEHSSSLNAEDTSVHDTIPIPHPSLSIPSMVSLASQDTQGYNQQEGIDYDETFAHVVRLEAIKFFLVFANYMNFIVYQMDVKSTYLNDKLTEAYVKQPPDFESSEFPRPMSANGQIPFDLTKLQSMI
ncbi:retrovirus-related pol polyprotein from transposon TNT 1-94 [Tanacetum coccineum]